MREGFVQIESVLGASGESWELHVVGVRRLFFVCRTSGYTPGTPVGLRDFLTRGLGLCRGSGQEWAWSGDGWWLVLTPTGVEFLVPDGVSPGEALGFWAAFLEKALPAT